MESPIFIIGRQHSGNTMLARCLGQSPEVYSATGEGTFFEHQERLAHKPAADRAVDILAQVEGSGAEVTTDDRPKVQQHMRGPGGRAEETAGQMYARCMGWVARQNGARRWVQKATSYIFYVEDILECFPEARLLFLSRNPLDLAASMKRRGGWRAVARMVHGWNKGVRLARRFSQERSENLTVIRYEDFVRAPKEEMKKICSFCDLRFRDDLLQVPHVNRSESPYNQSSHEGGIQSSRIGYYDETLTPVEEGAVRALVDDPLLKQVYPELIGEASPSVPEVSYAAVLSAVGVLTTGGQHLKTFLSEPRHVLQRVKKRLLA